MILVNLLPSFAKIGGDKLITLILKAINERFYSTDLIYNFETKQPTTRLTLLLPGKGCSWALGKSGGCTMCGFSQSVREIGKKFTDRNLLSLYETAEIATRKQKPKILTIYNAGSFINNTEISSNVQMAICQKVEKHPTIEILLIETRAEFVTEEKIKTLKKSLGKKNLIVALGLEAQDDKIRNIYINKGLTKKTFEKAVKIIRESGAKPFAYVFIKPIFLTEKQAIEEAIKTAKYAFDCGTEEIAFESAFVQPGTLMEKLYKQKKFTPPWLWSIIEVIKKTRDLGNVRIGGFEDEPPPIAIPSNCPKCSENIKKALQRYRENNDIDELSGLNCFCKEKWKKAIKL